MEWTPSLVSEMIVLEQKCIDQKEHFRCRSRFFFWLSVAICTLISICGGIVVFFTLEPGYTEERNILLAIGSIIAGIPIINEISGFRGKSELFFQTSKIFEGIGRNLRLERSKQIEHRENPTILLHRMSAIIDQIEYLIFSSKLDNPTEAQIEIGKILQKHGCKFDSGSLICPGIV